MIIVSQSVTNSKDELNNSQTFAPENYGLIFKKSVFDIAFIVTHKPHLSKIDNLQSYFQSELKFTTYCIFLQNCESLSTCLRDLKAQDASYALVLHESFDSGNIYDLYVLHRDEVLTNITVEKVNDLIMKDFNNLMNKVKILKNIPSKWPHTVNKEDEKYTNMNERLRYYFCLLSDHRLLTMGELLQVKDYLVIRKELLQKSKDKSNIFANENYIQPSKFVFKGPNRTGTVVQFNRPEEYASKLPVKYTIFDASSANSLPPVTFKKIQPSNIINSDSTSVANTISRASDDLFYKGTKDHSHSLYKETNPTEKSDNKERNLKRKPDNKKYSSHKKSMYQADIKCMKYVSNPMKIEKVQLKTAKVSKLIMEYSKAKISNTYLKKVDKSFKMKYFKSSYYKSRMKYVAPNIINAKSAVSLNQKNHDSINSNVKSITRKNKNVIDLSNGSDEDHSKYNKIENKRKSETTLSPSVKISKLDTSFTKSKLEIVNNPIFTPHKSSPDGLINLFVMVLNLVPLELPNDNCVYTILSNSCDKIQEGILEPALKNVKVNYDSCKTNGVTEVIANIYSIFNEAEKEVKNKPFMNFIWSNYFPKEISNFSLIILFYRFVKLLMLYTMFNKSLVTKKLVLDVIEKIDVIVNFDFKSSVSTFKKKQLSCFSQKFDKYFKEHDQLHALYSKLSNSKSLAVNSKKLDTTIKKKKIEFTIGPLLNYFIFSINSIHHKMEPFQIEVIYGAIRTLRFCLRKINLKLVQTSFTKPYLFNFKTGKMEHHCAEVKKEINWLCKELKYYQCVLFTEKHYDLVNCLLDFSWRVECTINMNLDSSEPKSNFEPLLSLNPAQFIQTFISFQCPIFLQYHPESELEYLKAYLKERWTSILHEAFIGSLPEPCGARINKEINVLLPPTWGLFTFNEAILESSKIYYEKFQKLAETDPIGWYTKFSKSKSCAKNWLIQYQLPVDNLEVLNDYQYVLESKYKYS